jgi:photosystem II stability/assembly factor-like uncharacterized protein
MMKKVFTFLILILLLLLNQKFLLSQTGWFMQQSGTDKHLTSSSFINENTGWIVGNKGVILKTTNAGLNWIQQNNSDTTNLLSVSFCNERIGWAVGGEYYYTPLTSYRTVTLKTSNGGTDWIGSPSLSYTIINNVHVFDSLNVIIISSGVDPSGFSSAGSIGRTSNGGLNWYNVSPSSNFGYGFTSLFFLNQNTGWAIGLFSTDVGAFKQMYIKTSNAGINWTILRDDSVGTPLNTGKLQYVNEFNGYLYQEYQNILSSSNGGMTWSNLINAKDFYFYNIDTGWVINNSNQILRTNDGGVSWNPQNSPTAVLGNMNFVNAETGWIVGNNGAILKTITGGLTNIQQTSTITPKNFSLSQNYPNPFNPVTNIKFSLPSTQYTILKIFDITGREVATLVNEKLQAGEYEFMFDSNELSSGVYFYQLRTDKFIQTRKMVLTK